MKSFGTVLILLWSFTAVFAQKEDFKYAIKKGPDKGGIYTVEYHDGKKRRYLSDDLKKYDLQKLKKFLNNKGYNLSEVQFLEDGTMEERAGDHFVKIKIDREKNKISYGHHDKIIGSSHKSKHQWASSYLGTNKKCTVASQNQLRVSTLSKTFLFNFHFNTAEGAKYYKSVAMTNARSSRTLVPQYLKILDDEMDYLVNGAQFSHSKALLFFIRIQPWVKSFFYRYKPTFDDYNFSKDKVEKKVRRHILNAYKTSFEKIKASEKQFTNSRDLQKYITFLDNISRFVWNSTAYTDYVKEKKALLEELILKEKAEAMEANRKMAADNNLLLRHTFNFGVIGKDYVPPVMGSYNAGKTYQIGEVEVQEKDYRRYVKEGGYDKDVEGYTAVYQIINNSTEYKIVEVDLNCTGKFSDIVKRSWLNQLVNWTVSNYKTKYAEKRVNQSSTYIIAPKTALKDQVIVGEEEPIDFIFTVVDILTVEKVWVVNLNLAITGDDIPLIDQYLKDPKAKAWYNKLEANKNKIIQERAQAFSKKYTPSIKANIQIVDDLLFDKDFESEVTLIIKNTSDIPLLVDYTCPFKSDTIKIEGGAIFKKRHTIKGITKNKLKVKINKVSKL